MVSHVNSQLKKIASIQLIDTRDQPIEESGIEEVETNSTLILFSNKFHHTETHFKKKKSYLFSVKYALILHFVNEIPTPPPEV